MRGITKLTYIAIAGVVLLSLAGTPAWSVTYGKLSKNHTLYGVSQFLAGGVSPTGKVLVKLVNPTPVTMVAVALFYEREDGKRGGTTPETFLRCVVEELSPHAAIQIESKTECASNSSNNPECVPQYVEVISVPMEPVQVKKNTTRLADGLGIVGSPNNFQGNFFLLNPGLFSLPTDSVVDGQREYAIDSICTALQEKKLSPDLFEEFGIFCP